jgi:uncharacterized OB-fold protein
MRVDHPFPAVRAREITRWCETDAFRRIQQSLGEEAGAPRCPKCGAVATAGWKFCQQCGAPLEPTQPQ